MTTYTIIGVPTTSITWGEQPIIEIKKP